MKGDFDLGNLVHWARLDLGLALDEDYSISDERAREFLAQIASGDADRPLMELVAAYGRQMRRIFAAHVKDAEEREEAENEFWTTVVQSAGKYGGKASVVHWLAVIARRQAIASHQRQVRRMKRVVYRAEIASKRWNAGEEDDLDLERLADKDAVAEERMLTPDEVLEQEELAKEAHRVVMTFLGSVDEETAEAIIRNKADGITIEVWARRTGKSGELLRTRISRAYRKMRKRVPLDLRWSLVHVYRGGDLEYAKRESKKQRSLFQ